MGYISSRSILIKCESCVAEEWVFQLLMATVRFTTTMKLPLRNAFFCYPSPCPRLRKMLVLAEMINYSIDGSSGTPRRVYCAAAHSAHRIPQAKVCGGWLPRSGRSTTGRRMRRSGRFDPGDDAWYNLGEQCQNMIFWSKINAISITCTFHLSKNAWLRFRFPAPSMTFDGANMDEINVFCYMTCKLRDIRPLHRKTDVTIEISALDLVWD